MIIKKQQLFIIFIIFGLWSNISCSHSKSVINPEIINITSSSVTIAWSSKKPYGGKIFYHPAGIREKAKSIQEKFDHSYQHEVTIENLKTGTQYIYWINNKEKKYFFRTKPEDVKAFSFIIELNNLSENISSILMSEMPHFFLSFSKKIDPKNNYYKSITPYVPVYNLNGQNSIYLKKNQKTTKALPWKLDWGGLTLIFIEEVWELDKFLNSPTTHTIGIIMKNNKKSINSNLHKMIMAHNRSFPSNKIAFVISTGSKIKKTEMNKINYIEMPLVDNSTDKKNNAIRVDVNIETTYAVLLDTKKEIILKSPPLKKQRTCIECRRLASIGSYNESVKAYKEFIQNNQGHYQIDDAFYAIAEIMDTKLFKFNESMIWYKNLLTKYPKSTLSPLAKQRMEYLSKYSDYNFKPLSQFEKIRRVDYIKIKNNPGEKEKVLIKAEKIIETYKNAKILPAVYYWLANQYRNINIQKAKMNYLALAEKYPHHEYAREIWWEIGEAYYGEKKYYDAIEAFNKALKTMPSSSEEIKAQIFRAKRNLRRKYFSTISLLLLIIIISLSIFLKPPGIEKNKFVVGGISFIILFIIFFFASWLIMEQFASKAELMIITTCISAAFTLGFPFSHALSNKIVKYKPNINNKYITLLGVIINLIISISIFYLTIFYTNEHFLIIFKL